MWRLIHHVLVVDQAAEATAEFTISPRTLILQWSATSLVYNGKEQTPEVDAKNVVGTDTISRTSTDTSINASDAGIDETVESNNEVFKKIFYQRLKSFL